MALWLFAQPLYESNNKENIRAPHNRLIVRVIPRWDVSLSIILPVLKYRIIALVFGLCDLVVGKLGNYTGSMTCLTPVDWFQVPVKQS